MFTEVFEFCICVVVTAVQLFYILSAIKGIELSDLVNDLLKKEIEIIEIVK